MERRTRAWLRGRTGGSVFSALACLVVLAGCATAAAAEQPSGTQHRPVAVVYRGPAGCSGCSEAVAALLRRSPLHFRVSYIGPHEKRTVTAANLRGVDLYAQPGGSGSVAHGARALGQAAAHAIKAYVAAGGHYLGFCMGAYLAGSDPGMGLLAPGNTGEYDKTRGAEVTTAAEAVIPLRWGGSIRYQYVQDAPYIVASGVPGEQILSRFTNGRINALVRPYKNGGVGVVGSHPEADRSWYTARMWRQDRDGLDYAQGLQLIAATMKL
jgi:biotin protein ligase-like protein